MLLSLWSQSEQGKVKKEEAACKGYWPYSFLSFWGVGDALGPILHAVAVWLPLVKPSSTGFKDPNVQLSQQPDQKEWLAPSRIVFCIRVQGRTRPTYLSVKHRSGTDPY